MTSWGTTPRLCCSSCGNKFPALYGVGALLFGWWGFPWGLVAAPVQFLRNVGGLFSQSDGPSAGLSDFVRINYADLAATSHQSLPNPGQPSTAPHPHSVGAPAQLAPSIPPAGGGEFAPGTPVVVQRGESQLTATVVETRPGQVKCTVDGNRGFWVQESNVVPA